jgi:hypothetical protein
MENIQENRKIEISQESLGYLDTTRKWTMFFAILGFIGVGIMMIFGLVFGLFMSAFSSKLPGIEGVEGMENAGTAGGIAGIAILVIMVIFAIVYFFPLLFLVRFSKHTANAVAKLDANELQTGLKNLKNYWKYIGILFIVFLSTYLVVLIFFGSTLALLKGLR